MSNQIIFPTDDTSLSSFTINGTQVVDGDSISVPYGTTSVDVEVYTTNPNATVIVSGNSGLHTGDNMIIVQVAAEDNTSVNAYLVTVTVEPSNDASLSSFTINGTQVNYGDSITVPYGTTYVDVNAYTANPDATFVISGYDGLQVGPNTVTVVVTSQDGTTATTYSVTVTVEPSSDTSLSRLTINGTLVNDGDAITVPYGTTSVTVSAYMTNPDATVVMSGYDGLQVGPNTVTVEVTAQNGNTATYTVTVTVEPSSDTSLSSFTINGTQVVDGDSISVPYGTTSVGVEVYTANPDATFVISGNYGLQVGPNTVTVEVTAQDRTTVTTYSVTVTVEPSNNAKITPSITNFIIPTKIYGHADFQLVDPSSNSKGSFSYVSSNSQVASIDGNTVTITGLGETTITVYQESTDYYTDASATASFIVASLQIGLRTYSINDPDKQNTGEYTFHEDTNAIRDSTYNNGYYNVYYTTEYITNLTRKNFQWEYLLFNTEILYVNIGNTVTSISDTTFADLLDFISINVNSNNLLFSSDDGILFDKYKTQLIYYPSGKLDNTYILPDSVTIIGNNAFSNSRIRSINLSKFASIGNGVFSNCSALTSINLPNVTSIGNSAFESCLDLESIDLPRVTIITNASFSGCAYLTSINLPLVVTINDNTFSGCIKLSTISLPQVTSIGNSAFVFCERLTSIYLPRISTFGDNAFSNCNPLTVYTLLTNTFVINNFTSVFPENSSLQFVDDTRLYGFTINRTQVNHGDTISVPYGTTYVDVEAHTINQNATVSISGNTGLHTGHNRVTVFVTSQDGSVTTTNTVTVTVEPSSDTKITPSITNFTIPTKTYGDALFTLVDPTSDSSGVFSYTSSDTSVATISGNTVIILKVGTSIITANQASNGNYTSGSITAVLNIIPTIIISGSSNPSLNSTLRVFLKFS